MIEQSKTNTKIEAATVMGAGVAEPAGAPYFTYDVECVGPDGEVRWSESITNLVTNEGRTDLINKYFKGAAYTAAWFLGLKGAGAAANTDTAATHAGWTEVNPYTGNRPAITFGTSSGTTTVSNTATAVSFTTTVAGPITVAGAFVQSVASGATGVLYSVADFSAARTVYLNDVLNVTLTVSGT